MLLLHNKLLPQEPWAFPFQIASGEFEFYATDWDFSRYNIEFWQVMKPTKDNHSSTEISFTSGIGLCNFHFEERARLDR